MSGSTQPLRVLIAVGSIDVGGTERQILEICRRLPRERFDVSVAVAVEGGSLKRALEGTGTKVYSLGIRRSRKPERRFDRALRLVRSIPRFRALLRTIRPDIVHAFLPEMSIVSAAARWPRKKPPLVISKRSLVRWVARDPVYFRLARWCNGQADLLLANSETVAREAVEREGADRSRLRVVFNGVDLARFRDSVPDESLARELGLPKGDPVLGMVANLNEYKGHVDLLVAAAKLRARGRRFTLLFVGGGGDSLEAVRARAAELDVPVIWAGPRDDVERVLCLMDVVVSASHEEGFSNAILEAMACGRAVVATAVGGSPEQIVDGESGRLVPPRDPESLAEALDSLLGNPALRSETGRAARQTVEQRFSLGRLLDEMEQVYRELAASGMPSPENRP